MLRITLLCLGVGVLGQVLPEGCPLTEPPAEQPPVERNTITTQASAPESASVGETVALTASATADLEGGTVSYSWLQILGPGVSILNADQAEAGFVAPSLPSDQTLGFLVTTTNERGDAGRAEIQVLVQADPDYGSGSQSGSDGPIARAGADREVPGDSTVTLNGSTSQGTNLTYLWKQVGGGLVELQNADSAQATFVAPPYSPAGINRLEFELEVRDNRGRRSTDRIVITMVEPPDTDPTPRLLISTSLGSITVELDRENAPITVNNFLRYVEDGFYNGTIFHRVVVDFVIQGGGYEPGLVEKETRDPIENESDNGLDNERGTIAMARTNDSDSATSQFYINLVDNPTLDYSPGQPGYTVFGRVIAGMEVVDAIGAVAVESREGFQNVPVQDVLIRNIIRLSPDSSGGGDG